jgi:predicted DNA-binding transcriptional regulator AlpA
VSSDVAPLEFSFAPCLVSISQRMTAGKGRRGTARNLWIDPQVSPALFTNRHCQNLAKRKARDDGKTSAESRLTPKQAQSAAPSPESSLFLRLTTQPVRFYRRAMVKGLATYPARRRANARFRQSMVNPNDRPFLILRAQDVCTLLGISYPTLQRLRREGLFPEPTIPGRKPRWSSMILKEFVAGRWRPTQSATLNVTGGAGPGPIDCGVAE